MHLFVVVVDSPDRPRVNRGIDVVEIPLVGRHLAAGMEVMVAEEQSQLLFGKIHVYQRQRDGVESEIPDGIPRILPLVGHGDHVRVVHVEPVLVADFGMNAFLGLVAMLAQPLCNVVIEKLLAPKHPGQGLPHDQRFFLG